MLVQTQPYKENTNFSSVRRELFLIVILVLIICTVKAFLLWLNPPGPSCFDDELLYRKNAEAIWNFDKYFYTHYPPIYPLSLALAFIFEDWYKWMLLVNVFISSLLVPATWFLSRSVNLRRPMIAAAISAVLPLHNIFPNFIVSENLFVPLFVLAVALALRGSKGGAFESFTFGLVLSLAQFTKFLFLPALPVLIVIWLHARCKKLKNEDDGNIHKVNSSFVPLFIGYGIVTCAWIIYGMGSGFDLNRLFGFGVAYSKTLNSELGSASHLLMWGSAYAFYIVLAWLPLWGIILAWLVNGLGRGWLKHFSPTQKRLLVVQCLFVAGYWLIATQHSFRASYNYPEPQYLIGRYLAHLTPIFLVTALLFLEKFIIVRRKNCGLTYAVIGTCSIAILALLSWNVLFGQAVWDFPKWFARIPFNSVDIFALRNKWIFACAILFAIIPFVAARLPKSTVSIQTFLVGSLFLTMFVSNGISMHTSPKIGRHAKEMASPISNLFEKTGKRVYVYLNYEHLPIRMAENGLAFFNVPKKKFIIRFGTSATLISQHDTSDPALLITRSSYHATPLHEYALGDEQFKIYNYDDPKMFAPEIIDYGPKRVVAGSSFNIQPSGSSAMWFKLKNLTSDTNIGFDENRLQLILGKDGFASATIPSGFIQKPRTVRLSVWDKKLGLKGNSVNLIIDPPN